MTNRKQKSLSMLAKCTMSFDTKVKAPKPRQIVYISPQQSADAQKVCEAICNGLEAFGKIAGGILSVIAQ